MGSQFSYYDSGEARVYRLYGQLQDLFQLHLGQKGAEKPGRKLGYEYFDCSAHKQNSGTCGGHFIRVSVLEQLALKYIQTVTGYILCHEKHFRRVMETQMRIESAEKRKANRKRLAREEKRIAELRRLFIKVYDDKGVRIFFGAKAPIYK